MHAEAVNDAGEAGLVGSVVLPGAETRWEGEAGSLAARMMPGEPGGGACVSPSTAPGGERGWPRFPAPPSPHSWRMPAGGGDMRVGSDKAWGSEQLTGALADYRIELCLRASPATMTNNPT